MTKDVYYFDDCYEEDICDILGMPDGRYYHSKVKIDNVIWFFISINKLTEKEMIGIVKDDM